MVDHLSTFGLEKMDHIQRRGFSQVINIWLVSDAKDQNTAAVKRLFGKVEGILNLAEGIAGHVGIDLRCQLDEACIIVQGFQFP